MIYNNNNNNNNNNNKLQTTRTMARDLLCLQNLILKHRFRKLPHHVSL